MTVVHKCCGQDCFRFYDENPAEPCWGGVSCVDEYWDEENNDIYRTATCEGHDPVYNDGAYDGVYEPEPAPQ